jgi:protein-disulfide isomerase
MTTANYSRAILAILLLAGLTPAAAAADKDVVAIAAGQPITAAEVEQAVANRMFRLRTDEYRMRAAAIDEIVSKRLLDAEAARRGVAVDELLRQEVDAKIELPTVEQTRMIYEATKDRFGSVPEEGALAQITANLQSQRAATRRAAFLSDLRSKANVKVMLEPPRLAVTAGNGPARGPAQAPVTIVEYSDFECPFCSRASATVAEVLKRYPTQVRLVFHHYPLPIHHSATLAAKAATCAGEQGKFWEMHDLLFKNQTKLSAPDLVGYAQGAGVDSAAYARCMTEQRIDSVVAADQTAGASYGITGTPAFFINGRLLVGAVPLGAFTSVIDDELARAGIAGATPKEAASLISSR